MAVHIQVRTGSRVFNSQSAVSVPIGARWKSFFNCFQAKVPSFKTFMEWAMKPWSQEFSLSLQDVYFLPDFLFSLSDSPGGWPWTQTKEPEMRCRCHTTTSWRSESFFCLEGPVIGLDCHSISTGFHNRGDNALLTVIDGASCAVCSQNPH